jgi:WD40 repeat protein
VAERADGLAVREDDVEPELLDEESMLLGDGEIVAMAVKEFDPLRATEELSFEGHKHITCLTLHNNKLFSGSWNKHVDLRAPSPSVVKVWNVDTWTLERTLEGHTDGICCLLMHGDMLLSSGGDRTIRAWNTNTWLCERTLERDPSQDWGSGSGVCKCGGGACDNLVMHGEKLIEGRTSGSSSGVILVWNTDTIEWTCERTIEEGE